MSFVLTIQRLQSMTNSTKKTYLLTGASSGIGYAIGSALLAKQHHLISLGRHLDQAYKQNETSVNCINVDFAQLAQLVTVLKQLKLETKQLDGIICCAGYGQFGGLEQFSYQQIEDLMNVNFVAHAHICKTFLPLLKSQGYGDIIFIASDAALKGSRQGSIYCASKFALRGFAQALRDECARAGLRVTLINPGMVNTRFYDQLHFSPGDAAENTVALDEIAKTVSHVLESDTTSVYEEITLTPLHKVVKKT